MANQKDQITQNKAVTKALSSVGTTVEAFADRMKRKLKEQETLADQSRKASDARHALILQSLTTIRKALQETAKITLGDRFSFELDISDWEGWPRLDLNLIDSTNPEIINHALIVTAHDRNELGLIQLNLKSGECIGRVMLKDPEEFEKLPIVLKRAIRKYLDTVTPYILNPAPEKENAEKKAAQPSATTVEDVATNKALQTVDFFVDDQDGQDNIVES